MKLAAVHGPIVDELIDAGKIPMTQVCNFFGRAEPRRIAILAAIESGRSYSKAYKESAGQFDTKNWNKVSVRTGAVRGHLLKTTARIACRCAPDEFSSDEVRTLQGMARQLSESATELIRQVLDYDLQEVSESPSRKSGRKAVEPIVFDSGTIRFNDIHQQLATAITKLKKTVRDVPQMGEQLGAFPSVRNAACVLVEAGRIVRGVPLFISSLKSPVSARQHAGRSLSADDLWGIGGEYAHALAELPHLDVPTRHIATHRDPDADALAAAWIAESHLFPGHKCQTKFLERGFVVSDKRQFDCVVDVGRAFDPGRLLFDHKPPAFQDRNETCATRLVWQHASELDYPVDHLVDIVELVHDGDAATRRPRSNRYARSRRIGFHALIRHAQSYSQCDQMLYQAIKLCLDCLVTHPAPHWACAAP